MAKILLVDDDTDQNQMIAAYLLRENHVVETADSGERAKDILAVSGFDLIVLDWNLPDIEGVDLLKWYRGKGNAPVIMLTGKIEIPDKEQGLDAGADDYLVKPFDMKELTARIRALLRRPPTYTGGTLTAGEYTLHPATLTLTRSDQELRLPPREFALLEFLARHPNEIFKGETLIQRVWHSESDGSTDSLRTAIKQIRKKLGNEQVIEYVAGAGYRLGS